MFDLEKAIADWRRQMAAGGIKSPGALDELESHLCDDVEQQVRSGRNEPQAFETAVQRIGQASALTKEFEKAGETDERKFMKRFLIISAGVIGVLVGMAFVMPAVAQYRHEGAMTNESVGLFLLGLALTVGGAGASFCGVKRRNA